MNVLKVISSKRKILLSVIVLFIVLFAGYMYKYQQVINEGSAIFEERCLTIDPLVAKHKEIGEKWLNAYQASESAEVITSYSDEYNEATQELIEKSALWLKKNKEFLNKRDFQFFTHPALKGIFFAINDKFHADYLANVAYLIFALSLNNRQIYYENYLKAVQNISIQEERLTNQTNKAKQNFDIRSYFTKVPKLRCSEVNDNPGLPVIINGPTG